MHNRCRSCATMIQSLDDSEIYELIVCLAHVVCSVEHHSKDTRASSTMRALRISVSKVEQQLCVDNHLPDNK